VSETLQNFSISSSTELKRKIMNTLLQKIKTVLLGPPGDEGRSGMSISSSAPVSDFKPKRSQPFGSSIELDEDAASDIGPNGELRSRRPAGAGWVWDGGQWSRPIRTIKRCGCFHGIECECIDSVAADREANEQRMRSRSRTLTSTNDPIQIDPLKR
jgi:hypothetical protein